MDKKESAKMHHVALFVADMNRAQYLFQDILGFELAWHAPTIKGHKIASLLGIPDVIMEIIYLQNSLSGVAVELCRMIHPAAKKQFLPFGSPGSTCLSLQVKNLDQLHNRLTRDGWTPFSPCLNMRDPEGHPVRLFCFPAEEGIVMELIENALERR
ncbi:MAG: hypothetical protein GY846_20180 [Deltaproteobacteria bacterium]|nr:hypothetical protein [Deltaproteobacteria bacterium]